MALMAFSCYLLICTNPLTCRIPEQHSRNEKTKHRTQYECVIFSFPFHISKTIIKEYYKKVKGFTLEILRIDVAPLGPA